MSDQVKRRSFEEAKQKVVADDEDASLRRSVMSFGDRPNKFG